MAKTTAKTSAKCTKCCSKKSKTVAASYTPREVSIPEDYEPIGMWGYFGYEFLFAIPLVGWILCISFAFMAKNINLRNFARSQFCYLIIYIIIVCILAGFGVIGTIFESLGMI